MQPSTQKISFQRSLESWLSKTRNLTEEFKNTTSYNNPNTPEEYLFTRNRLCKLVHLYGSYDTFSEACETIKNFFHMMPEPDHYSKKTVAINSAVQRFKKIKNKLEENINLPLFSEYHFLEKWLCKDIIYQWYYLQKFNSLKNNIISSQTISPVNSLVRNNTNPVHALSAVNPIPQNSTTKYRGYQWGYFQIYNSYIDKINSVKSTSPVNSLVRNNTNHVHALSAVNPISQNSTHVLSAVNPISQNSTNELPPLEQKAGSSGLYIPGYFGTKRKLDRED